MAQAMTSHKNKSAALILLTFSGLYATATQADQLADIQKAGLVKLATYDADPYFGGLDAKIDNLHYYQADSYKFISY